MQIAGKLKLNFDAMRLLSHARSIDLISDAPQSIPSFESVKLGIDAYFKCYWANL
jgi:hypothetical protein